MHRAADPDRRIRVLFINRSYWPDVEATGQYLTELCEDLAEEFEVHVLCGRPQQIVGQAGVASYGTSEHRGVTIHRVRHTQFDKASFWGRLANMVTFQWGSAWRAFRVPRPDLTVVETDPPLLCLLGWCMKTVRRTRLICYQQDIYPDVAVALGKLRNGWAVRTLRRLFFAVYRRATAVFVLSRDMRQLMLDGGVPAEKIYITTNWVDTDKVYPIKANNAFRREHGLTDKFVVMYSGNMGLSQRLEQVLDAAGRLQHREDIVFVMIGAGADRRNLERLAAEKKLTNVRFFGYQPKANLADSLSAADVQLVIMRPEVKQLLMPSKLYGVMASGTPAMVISDRDTELADVVLENDAGALAPSEDTAELVAAIVRYADSPEEVKRQGESARAYAEANCRREMGVGRIAALLRELGGAKPNQSVAAAQTPVACEAPLP